MPDIDTLNKIDSLGCSIILAGLLLVAYLFGCWRRRAEPNLAQGLTIAIAAFGVVAAVDLGWVAYSSSREELGVLAVQKPAIVIGAFSMAWVSISSAYKVLINRAI
ncbi:hypothetical protein [Stutzerimonas nitrititolerans]|uniref:hypothetical protein n=1 Tax=Stutzerimonas nitrititolerans TaxID=2482751 RepID=UPI00289F95F6|nr:hypothetical protein [Stutzerimonas nitrititolerans]